MSNVARRPLLMEKEKAHALKMFEPEIMDRSVNRDQVMVMFGHTEPVWFFCYGWVQLFTRLQYLIIIFNFSSVFHS